MEAGRTARRRYGERGHWGCYSRWPPAAYREAAAAASTAAAAAAATRQLVPACNKGASKDGEAGQSVQPTTGRKPVVGCSQAERTQQGCSAPRCAPASAAPCVAPAAQARLPPAPWHVSPGLACRSLEKLCSRGAASGPTCISERSTEAECRWKPSAASSWQSAPAGGLIVRASTTTCSSVQGRVCGAVGNKPRHRAAHVRQVQLPCSPAPAPAPPSASTTVLAGLPAWRGHVQAGRVWVPLQERGSTSLPPASWQKRWTAQLAGPRARGQPGQVREDMG